MTLLENRPATAVLVIDVQNGVVQHAHDRDRVIANVRTLVDKTRAAAVPLVEDRGQRPWPARWTQRRRWATTASRSRRPGG